MPVQHQCGEIAKLAVGPEHYPEPLTEWETLLRKSSPGTRSVPTAWTIYSEIRTMPGWQMANSSTTA
jgi:hypothetical protein